MYDSQSPRCFSLSETNSRVNFKCSFFWTSQSGALPPRYVLKLDQYSLYMYKFTYHILKAAYSAIKQYFIFTSPGSQMITSLPSICSTCLQYVSCNDAKCIHIKFLLARLPSCFIVPGSDSYKYCNICSIQEKSTIIRSWLNPCFRDMLRGNCEFYCTVL
jgi:hypothetical protein